MIAFDKKPVFSVLKNRVLIQKVIMGTGMRLCSMFGLVLCLGFNCILPSFCLASTLRVPEDHTTIQSAIDASVNGDTVLINDGTYTGDGNRDIDFHGKAIVVKSINGATNTIIDCQADSTDPHRGFFFHSGEDSLSILQGLTIQGGFAPGNVDSGQSNGGGILCDSSSSPIIKNCLVTQNRSQNAGGGIAILNSSPFVIECEISYDTSRNYSDFAIPGYGGGVMCQQSSTKLVRCEIRNNRANIGGGVACNNSDAIFDFCQIANNAAVVLFGLDPYAAGIGGGMYLYNGSPTISNCTIYRNSAETLFGALFDDGKGGGAAIVSSFPLIKKCSIVFNEAQGWPNFFNGEGAGVLCATNSVLQLEQSIIAYNKQAEGIFTTSSSQVNIFCSDIFGNEFGDWTTPIDSQLNTNNNFSLDPQFCDPSNQDFLLSQTSPCLEGHSLCGERVGANGMGCVTTGVGEEPDAELPQSFTLHQNYPNPFNGTTTINFDSLTKAPFHLRIYNLLGQTVYHTTGTAYPGSNMLTWNSEDAASGVYFYSLTVNTAEQTRKMVLEK